MVDDDLERPRRQGAERDLDEREQREQRHTAAIRAQERHCPRHEPHALVHAPVLRAPRPPLEAPGASPTGAGRGGETLGAACPTFRTTMRSRLESVTYSQPRRGEY